MKALVLYITAILTVVIFSTEVSLTWLFLIFLDMILITWCYNNITLKEFIKYSGYSTWYKFLKIWIMKERDSGRIVWIVLKVLFFLLVGSALLVLLENMLGAAVHCLQTNAWIDWVLSIAFWVGVIWWNEKK